MFLLELSRLLSPIFVHFVIHLQEMYRNAVIDKFGHGFLSLAPLSFWDQTFQGVRSLLCFFKGQIPSCHMDKAAPRPALAGLYEEVYLILQLSVGRFTWLILSSPVLYQQQRSSLVSIRHSYILCFKCFRTKAEQMGKFKRKKGNPKTCTGIICIDVYLSKLCFLFFSFTLLHPIFYLISTSVQGIQTCCTFGGLEQHMSEHFWQLGPFFLRTLRIRLVSSLITLSV